MNKKNAFLSVIMGICLIGSVQAMETEGNAGIPPQIKEKENPIIAAARENVKMRKKHRTIWALITTGNFVGAGVSASYNSPELTEGFLWGAGITAAMTLNAHFNVEADERWLKGVLAVHAMAGSTVPSEQPPQ